MSSEEPKDPAEMRGREFRAENDAKSRKAI